MCFAVLLSVGVKVLHGSVHHGPVALVTEPALYREVLLGWPGLTQGHCHFTFVGMLAIKTRENVFLLFLFYQKAYNATSNLKIMHLKINTVFSLSKKRAFSSQLKNIHTPNTNLHSL